MRPQLHRAGPRVTIGRVGPRSLQTGATVAATAAVTAARSTASIAAAVAAATPTAIAVTAAATTAVSNGRGRRAGLRRHDQRLRASLGLGDGVVVEVVDVEFFKQQQRARLDERGKV